MKNLVFLLSVVLLSSFTLPDDVPAIVQKEFEKKFALANPSSGGFAGAEKVKWDRQKDGRCDATFKWNDRKCTASFTASGEWLRTETILSYKELPLNVKKAINAKYITGSIRGASKIETPSGISYGVDFKHGYSPRWTQYAEDGTEM